MPDPHPSHRQRAHTVRLEWGPAGAAAIAPGCGVAVVVDVLSFTTSVTLAVERGATVLPYRWRDPSAEEYAAAHDAALAGGRRAALAQGAPSLSPASLVGLVGVERLVLPSPNGSTISLGLADSGASVVAACLRNAAAVADWLAPRAGEGIAVVAAGERWPDGSLRPAVEDLWGAGAVLAGLAERGVAGFSPEAELAASAYRSVAGRLPELLPACASGLELVDGGFAEDVRLAAELDASPVVPVLTGGGFTRG